MSDVSGVTSHFATANEGFNTTTSSQTNSGALTVGLNSVTGLTNGSVFVGVIEPAGTKEQVFTGTVDVSGSQITGVVWTKGTNVDHATGVSVVDYDTGTGFNMLSKGMRQEHKQSGVHDEAIITNRTADTTPASGDYLLTSDVSAANVLKKATLSNLLRTEGLVVPQSLMSDTGTDWVYTSFAPTLTNITIGNGTTVSYYRQIGKTVHFYGKVTAGTTTSFATDARISLPVNAAATAADRLPWGSGMLFDTSASTYYQAYMVKYPSAQTTWFLFMAVSTTPSYPPQTGAFPVAAGTSDELLWSIVYEAA